MSKFELRICIDRIVTTLTITVETEEEAMQYIERHFPTAEWYGVIPLKAKG